MSAKSRRKKAKSLSRATETRQPLPTFRIYTEGEVTEPAYIDALKRRAEFSESVAVNIEIIETGADPLHLVESAAADRERADRDIDQRWCVFDVEWPQAHPRLDQARQKAAGNDIRLAISNPCFELWLVLHYRAQTAHLSTDEAVRARRKLDGADDKHLSTDQYMELLDSAVRRAQSLRKRHRDNGTPFPKDNPSSSFDLLIAELRTAVKNAAEEKKRLEAEKQTQPRAQP